MIALILIASVLECFVTYPSEWTESIIKRTQCLLIAGSIRHTCIKLGLGKDACMREHVRSKVKENKKTKHLKAAFAPLAVNFAEWERGFSTMNAILTKQ